MRTHLALTATAPDLVQVSEWRSDMEEETVDLLARAFVDLETDEPDNVPFYRKFGFEVVKEVQVIKTTTLFMARRVASKGMLP